MAGIDNLEQREGLLKQRVQLTVLLVGTAIMLGKFYAFFLTNSVAILTDALESIVNVAAAAVSLCALYFAAKPKDLNHPFGHGKFEFLSASLEGLMILFAGGIIIYEAVYRFFFPAEIQSLDTGIIIIAAAACINYALGLYSISMGKKYDSVALTSGGKHLHSDAYSTLGMLVGLIVIRFTQISWLDSAVALIFGAIILLTGVSILRKTIANLTDEADPQVLNQILNIVASNRDPEWLDIHNLKITKYGGVYFIDCDLTLPMNYTISQGHAAYSRLKQLLLKEFSEKTSFCIHFDSCEAKLCNHCKIPNCTSRKENFSSSKPYTIQHITEVIQHS